MARQRRLIIGNADKIFNLEFEHQEEREEYIDVLPDNTKKIKEELRELADMSEGLPIRDGNKYIIFHTAMMDDELVELLFRYGGEVIYYTNSIAPSHVLELVAENRYTSSVMYALSSGIDYGRADNIEIASSAGKVSIDILADDVTPFEIIVALDKIKYAVDTVYLYFDKLTHEGDADAEYDYFVDLRDALANWKMNIVMIYTSEEELARLEYRKNTDSKIRKSTTVW